MLIPRYWSRAESHAVTPAGKPVRFHVWRGSRTSPADAQALAQEAVGRIASRIQAGQGFPERYAYGDRPLREEVVREFPAAAADAPDAAITRNSYGALVLNAARAFFIDVDVPREESQPSRQIPASAPHPLWGLVDALPVPPGIKSIAETFLGPRTPRAAAAPPPAPADPSTGALGTLRTFLASRPDWRVRVYRTHSGLRYLVTHAPFTPADSQAQFAMTALGADPQYIRLCQVQKSFRARLTPKPWRVGLENPPTTFPYESPSDEAALRQWVARYDAASAGRATCQFIEELGGGTEHPDVAALRALHDEHTRATSNLPLA